MSALRHAANTLPGQHRMHDLSAEGSTQVPVQNNNTADMSLLAGPMAPAAYFRCYHIDSCSLWHPTAAAAEEQST